MALINYMIVEGNVGEGGREGGGWGEIGRGLPPIRGSDLLPASGVSGTCPSLPRKAVHPGPIARTGVSKPPITVVGLRYDDTHWAAPPAYSTVLLHHNPPLVEPTVPPFPWGCTINLQSSNVVASQLTTIHTSVTSGHFRATKDKLITNQL